MRLFKWFSIYIAARSQKEARALLLDRYTPAEVRRGTIEPHNDQFAFTSDGGDTWDSVSGDDVGGVWLKPEIIPEY